MITPERLPRDQIKLPRHLDVLVHLPYLDTPKGELYCVATALQYNVSAGGNSTEEALTSLVKLVIDHCNDSLDQGINPLSIANSYYLTAFAIATPMPTLFAGVHGRVSVDLARYLDSPEVEVRSICEMQQTKHKFDIEDLVGNIAPSRRLEPSK